MTPPSPYDGDTSPASLGRENAMFYATALNECAFARSHGCCQRRLPEPATSSPSASEAYMSAKVALAGRDAAGDVDRLEFPGMIEAGGRGHFRQLVQGRAVEVGDPLDLVRHDQRALAGPGLGRDGRPAAVGVGGIWPGGGPRGP